MLRGNVALIIRWMPLSPALNVGRRAVVGDLDTWVEPTWTSSYAEHGSATENGSMAAALQGSAAPNEDMTTAQPWLRFLIPEFQVKTPKSGGRTPMRLRRRIGAGRERPTPQGRGGLPPDLG
jgi:hypothetical protein